MKITPRGYGTLSIEAENDAEKVYLATFLENLYSIGKKKGYTVFLDNILSIDMEDGCVQGEEDRPAKGVILTDVIAEDGTCFGLIDIIEISSFGF